MTTWWQKVLVAAGAVILAVILFGREIAAKWVEAAWHYFTAGGPALFLALALAGCSPGLIPGLQIQSSPQAGGMRTCAALSDMLTPGVSPLAIASMVLGAQSPSPGQALGADPAEGMRNCADVYDYLTPGPAPPPPPG